MNFGKRERLTQEIDESLSALHQKKAQRISDIEAELQNETQLEKQNVDIDHEYGHGDSFEYSDTRPAGVVETLVNTRDYDSLATAEPRFVGGYRDKEARAHTKPVKQSLESRGSRDAAKSGKGAKKSTSKQRGKKKTKKSKSREHPEKARKSTLSDHSFNQSQSNKGNIRPSGSVTASQANNPFKESGATPWMLLSGDDHPDFKQYAHLTQHPGANHNPALSTGAAGQGPGGFDPPMQPPVHGTHPSNPSLLMYPASQKSVNLLDASTFRNQRHEVAQLQNQVVQIQQQLHFQKKEFEMLLDEKSATAEAKAEELRKVKTKAEASKKKYKEGLEQAKRDGRKEAQRVSRERLRKEVHSEVREQVKKEIWTKVK